MIGRKILMKKEKIILKVAAAILSLGGCTVAGILINSSSVYAMEQAQDMISIGMYNDVDRLNDIGFFNSYGQDGEVETNLLRLAGRFSYVDVNGKYVHVGQYCKEKYFDKKNSFEEYFAEKITEIDNEFRVSNLCQEIVDVRKQLQLDLEKGLKGEKQIKNINDCLKKVVKFLGEIRKYVFDLKKRCPEWDYVVSTCGNSAYVKFIDALYEHEAFKLVARAEVDMIKYYLFDSFIFKDEFIDGLIRNLKDLDIEFKYENSNKDFDGFGNDIPLGLNNIDIRAIKKSSGELEETLQDLFKEIYFISEWFRSKYRF